MATEVQTTNETTSTLNNNNNNESSDEQISIMTMLQTNPPPDPLPDGWIMHRSRSQTGYQYYFNQFTGECKWNPPYVHVAPKPSQFEGLEETLASLRNGTIDGNSNTNSNSNTNNNQNQNDASKKTESVEDDDAAAASVRSILKKSDNGTKIEEIPARNTSSKSPHGSATKSKRRSSHSHSHSHSHHDHNERSKRSRTSSSDTPEKVRTFHILKKHRDSRRPASWRQAKITISRKEAMEELQELITILHDVASDPKELRATFEELAKTESDCPSAKRGGDLGFFGRKKMQPNFEKASFALGIGEMSDVVETSSGVHVILRIG
eukprot:178438_1